VIARKGKLGSSREINRQLDAGLAAKSVDNANLFPRLINFTIIRVATASDRTCTRMGNNRGNPANCDHDFPFGVNFALACLPASRYLAMFASSIWSIGLMSAKMQKKVSRRKALPEPPQMVQALLIEIN
jgi:hypothetical protein